jgi:hypothetical protein
MYSNNTILLVSSIFILTIVKLSVFLIPLIKNWNNIQTEDIIIKTEVKRLLESVDCLVQTLELFTKETNDKRAEIFLKLQKHDDKIEFIEKDAEKVNLKLEKLKELIDKLLQK